MRTPERITEFVCVPTYLNVPEIAEMLKLSKSAIYKMIKMGEIPSIRFGRAVRVKLDDLLLYLENKSL